MAVGVVLLGIIIITQTAPDNDNLIPVIVTLGLLGKMAISATFAIIIPYTKEFVPTSVR